MTEGHWEHFVHGADIGVRGVAPTLSGAFEQGALGLTAVITDPAEVAPTASVEVQCQAPDPELLFADWLNAVVFEMATRGMLFGRFEVELSGERLWGRLWGEAVEVRRHRPAVEVKGATYTELAVRQEPDGQWLAQCVVDV
jgi:SHS2 domain-containing protein